jgi:hypothetical protein
VPNANTIVAIDFRLLRDPSSVGKITSRAIAGTTYNTATIAKINIGPLIMGPRFALAAGATGGLGSTGVSCTGAGGAIPSIGEGGGRSGVMTGL